VLVLVLVLEPVGWRVDHRRSARSVPRASPPRRRTGSPVT